MIYLNEEIVPESKALISVFDHGFLYGDGIYETLRAYKGIVFKVDEHIERLFRSAHMINLDIQKTPETIRKAVYETIIANNHNEAVIRITISRGAGPVGLDPGLCPTPTFVIISNEFKEYPKQYYNKGVKIAIVNTRRNFKGALNPQIKSLNFLNNILAKIEAKNRNAYEAIMLNYRGYIAEGTITNLFFVKDQTLCTPCIDVGILDGITRRIIIDAAKQMGIEVREGRFRREEIYRAKEAFISNTTMEVLPVAEVDDVKIGSEPGPVTRMLHKAYKIKVAEYITKHKQNNRSAPAIVSIQQG
ncbi:MAG: branched-chain-amino-acid transaminase [Nitrospirae bacterium]|nr:branched-chain-amino-acid transaminase [Nitrospirota bacterium]